MTTGRLSKLPPELKSFMEEVEKADFYKKMTLYFDCSEYLRAIDGDKKDIIYKSLSTQEKREFRHLYLPLYNTIHRYSDVLRAIYNNSNVYRIIIESSFIQTSEYCHIAETLNSVIYLAQEALNSASVEDIRKVLEEVLKRLKSYENIPYGTPSIIEENGVYRVNLEAVDDEIREAVDMFRRLLIQLKCYISSMREFMEWSGDPDLLPAEFIDMEKGFINRFDGKEIKWRPFYLKAEEEYYSIDYKKLPERLNMFGENNIWINYYKDTYGG